MTAAAVYAEHGLPACGSVIEIVKLETVDFHELAAVRRGLRERARLCVA
jgi:hypothetical protein